MRNLSKTIAQSKQISRRSARESLRKMRVCFDKGGPGVDAKSRAKQNETGELVEVEAIK